ncbi:hypothetical protein BmR1_04g07330 [Babesia microti strain RI]|uniref:Uncharacterized protein n=1 Tax=Babesia microti (strain RI) TaxID=1133968 RepID=I7IHE2_BABMR|nr:hypothetical protein BmR1_04g07330 [Babesia microti strain RI]CCF75657.1 hypothetical protein BmR1_04g07330 [Babesia microti strain RI]|eukprot:XP_012650065.1 hypothetical protein BmR1_04g07330 [Babesia microti strain RI]
MDLCITHIDTDKLPEITSKGWNVLAINSKFVAEKSGLKSIHNASVSDTTLLFSPLNVLNNNCGNNKQIQILTRASVHVVDGFVPGNLNKLSGYSILAIEPSSQKTFQLCCENINADIITIDYKSTNLSWKVKRKLILAAIRRGLCFEICLGESGVFGNPNIIPHLNNLIRYIPLNKLIITSGCKSNDLLPLTTFVAHVALLLGVTHNEAFRIIDKSAKQCLYKAAARLTHQTGISKL